MNIRFYLIQLALILNCSEFKIFQIAAKEKGLPESSIVNHFKSYILNYGNDSYIPVYVKQFIDKGKEIIDGIKVFHYYSGTLI